MEDVNKVKSFKEFKHETEVVFIQLQCGSGLSDGAIKAGNTESKYRIRMSRTGVPIQVNYAIMDGLVAIVSAPIAVTHMENNLEIQIRILYGRRLLYKNIISCIIWIW